MEVNGKLCILHARAQAAFASILIPGLPDLPKERTKRVLCPLFLMQPGKPMPETK